MAEYSKMLFVVRSYSRNKTINKVRPRQFIPHTPLLLSLSCNRFSGIRNRTIQARPYMDNMEPAKLRRHENRGAYDIDSVALVFADSFMAHVSYVDNGLPQCLPMIALFHTIGDSTAVYLHGHPSSRLMELVRTNTNKKKDEGLTGEEDDDDKIKVCITSTKGSFDSWASCLDIITDNM